MGNLAGWCFNRPAMQHSPKVRTKPSTSPAVARDDGPRYLVVKRALQKMMETGQYAAGSALPNETTLADDLEVSVGTLRRAVDELVHEHLLVRRQGKGTYVALHKIGRAHV